MERTSSLVSRIKSHVIYHRLYADPPPRSELAPSQLTDEGLPYLPPPPPKATSSKLPKPAPPPPAPPAPPQPPSPPVARAKVRKKLRLVCLSNTHNLTSTLKVPAGDILVHAGDLTKYGTLPEFEHAIAWLTQQPHEIKLLTAGPRDGITLDPTYAFPTTHPPAPHAAVLSLLTSPAARAAGLHYLTHESRTITLRNGRQLRVFASPWTPRSGAPWGFGYDRGLEPPPWGAIPSDTELLITHGPPRWHLDAAGTPPLAPRTGCEALRRRLWEVRPLVHVFGQVPVGRGVEKVAWDCAARHVRFREARVLTIADAAATARRQVTVDCVRRPEHRIARGEETLLVNAAIATVPGDGPAGRCGKPVVVDLEVDCVDVVAQDGMGDAAQVRVRGVGEGWNSVAVQVKNDGP